MKKTRGTPKTVFFVAALGILILAGVFGFYRIWQGTHGTMIYVANEGEGTISVINAEQLKVIQTISLAGMPHNVNVDPRGAYFYATNHEGEEDEPGDEHAEHVPYLRILSQENNELLRSVAMGEMAAHVVPSRDGSVVYVSREGGNTLAEVDPESGSILRTFRVGEGPHGFVLSADGRTLYVPNMRSNDVSVVHVADGSEERITLDHDGHACETPVAMGITEDGRSAFVSCGKSFDVFKIDTAERKVVGRVAFEKGEFPGPIQMPVHPEGKYLYVPNMRLGVVHKIELSTFTLEKNIPTGNGAHGIAYSNDGTIAYVTNTWDNTVSAVDLGMERVIAIIPVGSKPNGIAVSNGKNQGW